MENAPRQKKKLPIWALILIVLGSIIIIFIIVIAILGFGLLNRLTRPGTIVPTASPTPAITVSAETPSPSATPTPTKTPRPDTELPLNDVYAQTRLPDDVLNAMETNRLNDAQYINVLLIGSDRRGNSGNSNSDTMMIATIDKKHNSLKLTTIMRDMLVDIPGHGYAKLNAAPAYGGYDLLMQTINQSFCLNINQYVMVDFKMFEKIVDRLGGITIRMSDAEISAANDCIAGLNRQRGLEDVWDGFIFAQAGNVKLTGKQALGYARIRHMDSDFVRTKRQFNVLNTIYSKFMRMSLTNRYAILYDLLPMVETNMTNDNILLAGVVALNLNVDGLVHHRIPEDNMYKSGRYDRKMVLLTDLPANAWSLHKFIYESVEVGSSVPELAPGASLPPRTPTPEWLLPTPTPYYDENQFFLDSEGNLVPIDPGI
ncbi:MAG: LCP family protein [Clostridia bacterium]